MRKSFPALHWLAMRWWLPCSVSCIGVAGLAFLLVWLVERGPLARWDQAGQAYFSKAFGIADEPGDEAPGVVYVTIRDISDQPWPWPALDYAILTNSLIPLFPQLVAFEHLPPVRDDGPHPVYTRQFQSQLDRLNQVVTPVRLFSGGPQDDPLPWRAFSIATVGNVQALPSYTAGLWPDKLYGQYPAGVIAYPPDGDNLIRRVPLVYRFRDRYLPSLALEAYCRYRQADWHYSGVVLGRHILLRDKFGDELERIPIDAEGCLALLPSREADPVQDLEFYSVILASEQRRHGSARSLDLGVFRNGIVVIGRDANETYQPLSTILGTLSSGELTARVIEQLTERRWLRPLGMYELSVLTLLLLSLSGFLALIHRWQLGNISLPLGGILLIGLVWLAGRDGVWASPICLISAWTSGWLIGWMWRDLFQDREGTEAGFWYRDQSELPF